VPNAHPVRQLVAEYVGSALLAAVVIGSGVAAQHLSPGQMGLELLEWPCWPASTRAAPHRYWNDDAASGNRIFGAGTGS
jgi:hypothetical protein